MKTTQRVATGVICAALALSFAACGTNNNGGGDNSASGAGNTGGTISLHGCTPQNPLIGGMTQEVCGGYILDMVGAQLVYYDSKTSEPKMDIAESITANDDSTVFTVKLNQGRLFQDGTEVKAHNFVDAWNYVSYTPNGMAQAPFFQMIKGWDDVQCGLTADGDADCDNQPAKTDTMSGLQVIDDYTFTITAAAPTSNLVIRLGYSAFQPLPDVFFTGDKDAFGKLPIQAGPYQVTENTATNIKMERFKDYNGPIPGHVDVVNYPIYNDINAAWVDVVANSLDFLDQVPSDQLIGDAWINTIGQNRTANTPGGTIQVLDYSPNDPQFKDNFLLRQAIGEAIDRDTITKQIFNGARVPMTGWVSPVIDGYTPNQCGPACVYDPEKAKADYEQSGGYSGTMLLSVNGDGGHKPWADAVCNSLNNVLGIDCQVNVTPNFATLLNQAENGELMGMFRAGWAMDYPSIEDYLTPIYGTGADSNYTNYANPAFMQKLADAAAAPTLDEANQLYQEAERMLAADLPSVPVWYYVVNSAWSDRLTNVIVNTRGWIDISAVQVVAGK